MGRADRIMSDDLNPLTLDIEHPNWYAFAECRGLTTAERDDIFFSSQGHNDKVNEARAICAVCPVRAECLDHAMTHAEHWGIWGGLTERERRRLRRFTRPAA
jgi:WhiB family redox-sensing transcriptional regulator